VPTISRKIVTFTSLIWAKIDQIDYINKLSKCLRLPYQIEKFMIKLAQIQ